MVQETEYIAPSCYDLLHGSEGTYRSHCPLYEHPPPNLTNSKTYEGIMNCLKRLQNTILEP